MNIGGATLSTLRLNLPQWQGGAMPTYHFGSQLLSWLAPPAEHEASIDIEPPEGLYLKCETGVMARSALLRQTDRALEVLEQRAHDKVVVLGGDCLVDLAPFAYLNDLYQGDLAVLWIDAHPDIATPDLRSNANAMVLGNLVGRGGEDFASRVKRPLQPQNVMYAGLYDMTTNERNILSEIGLRSATPNEIAESSDKILAWLKITGARNIAIHFDLDVLDPTELRTLYFSRPHAPSGAFDGIPQGRMKIAGVQRLAFIGEAVDPYPC